MSKAPTGQGGSPMGNITPDQQLMLAMAQGFGQGGQGQLVDIGGGYKARVRDPFGGAVQGGMGAMGGIMRESNRKEEKKADREYAEERRIEDRQIRAGERGMERALDTVDRQELQKREDAKDEQRRNDSILAATTSRKNKLEDEDRKNATYDRRSLESREYNEKISLEGREYNKKINKEALDRQDLEKGDREYKDQEKDRSAALQEYAREGLPFGFEHTGNMSTQQLKNLTAEARFIREENMKAINQGTKNMSRMEAIEKNKVNNKAGALLSQAGVKGIPLSVVEAMVASKLPEHVIVERLKTMAASNIKESAFDKRLSEKFDELDRIEGGGAPMPPSQAQPVMPSGPTFVPSNFIPAIGG